ncbi:MAG: T9SS type A sorting domain-containing protein [Ferruginibacter sp.]
MSKFFKQSTTVTMLLLCTLLLCNKTNAQNYFAGSNAGAGNTGTSATAVGTAALGGSNTGADNSAFGNSSMRANKGAWSNSAFGSHTLTSNVDGYFNTAIGAFSLTSNSSGSRNTAVGLNAMYTNTLGYNNTVIGTKALMSNTVGEGNCVMGTFAMQDNINGYENVAIGNAALGNSTAGNGNTAVGYYSAGPINLQLLTNCTFLGKYASTEGNLSSYVNATAIGYGAQVNANNRVRIGNNAVISIGGPVDWTNYTLFPRQSAGLQTSPLGLNFIMDLRPVSFTSEALQADARGEVAEKTTYTGLIPQELDAAAKKSGDNNFSGVDRSGENWGVRYSTLTVPLINAVQEINIQMAEENKQLNQRIEKLEAIIANMQQSKNTKVAETTTTSSTSSLFQNQPNPFNQTTTIQYQLVSDQKNAMIVISSLNGTVVKRIAITNTGKGLLSINANELAAGTYTYSLVSGSTIIDTKLMVIMK